ncbi:hypothetical protein OG874_13290 [Nocardia sp. NBC_00565]|uniref:hypothetical protein n=1 Tax=Nocardia sp. NBC_00565 TaxID=2975993 RepID=UPI002E81C224|nr:hypothetical protein [Nocardia sp. NBC_00565]WUC06045.1 hypothetical protein OG874_13290 [Nocardia sp. NBC_00565]
MNQPYSHWYAQNSPDNLPLAARYQSADPINWNGSLIYPMYTEQVGPAPILVTMTLLSAAPPAGLRGHGIGLSVIDGHIGIDGRLLAGVDVWSDALAAGVTFEVIPTDPGALFSLTPVWVDGYGAQKSWTGNYGIIIEQPPTGRLVLWCSVGEGPPNFANLVVEVDTANVPAVSAPPAFAPPAPPPQPIQPPDPVQAPANFPSTPSPERQQAQSADMQATQPLESLRIRSTTPEPVRFPEPQQPAALDPQWTRLPPPQQTTANPALAQFSAPHQTTAEQPRRSEPQQLDQQQPPAGWTRLPEPPHTATAEPERTRSEQQQRPAVEPTWTPYPQSEHSAHPARSPVPEPRRTPAADPGHTALPAQQLDHQSFAAADPERTQPSEPHRTPSADSAQDRFLAAWVPGSASVRASVAPPQLDRQQIEPQSAEDADLGYRGALYDLGVAMFRRGEEEQACGLWAQAADAGHAGAAYDLGVVRFRCGEVGDAEHWWRAAADRRESRAMVGLAELLQRQGNHAEAEVWRACAAEETSPEPDQSVNSS